MAIRTPEGYVGNLTDEQAAVLSKLKEKLSDFVKEKGGKPGEKFEGYKAAPAPKLADPKAPIEPGTNEEEASEANALLASEADMLRFCRARQFNVDPATEMAINSVKWRASVKPWTITPEQIPNALPSGVWRWAGYTKSGMPILHVSVENWRPSDYYSVDEYIRYLAYLLEGAISRMGEGVSRMCVIYWIPALNMEMMKPRANECAKVLMKVMQDQYPERLGVAFTCNAPALFSAMWRMVSPWIDPVTKAKFQIVPKGMAEETLLRYVDADVLSEQVGGKHKEYPIPTRPIQEEIADSLKNNEPPAASNVTAVVGCSDKTIMPGGLNGKYDGLINIGAGLDYSIQVHLEENTKKISWSFKEQKQREFNFGYKVTGAAAAAPAAPSMFSKSMFGNPAASLVASKGAGLLMNQDPSPVDFTKGAKEGSVDVQKGWSGGTLNLIFDNTAAYVFSATVEYEVTVDADEAK